MAHLGQDKLKLIHAHILVASKGLKEVKVKGQDPFVASPSMRRRPLIQRIFMPEAGPAAIAVAVNDELHYCWDAGECRLRYIWKGDFIDGWAYWKGNGNGLAKIQGDVLLREEKSPIAGPASTPPKFLGYSVRDGLPTFRYRLGELEVHEEIRPTADGKALVRSFSFNGSPKPNRLTFTSSEKIRYTSQNGTLRDSVLSLDSKHVGPYHITLTPQ